MAIIAGRTPSLQSRGYSGWLKPTLWRVSLERVPTNWRAGCGRSACPVRREGESHGFLPTPIAKTLWCFLAIELLHLPDKPAGVGPPKKRGVHANCKLEPQSHSPHH